MKRYVKCTSQNLKNHRMTLKELKELLKEKTSLQAYRSYSGSNDFLTCYTLAESSETHENFNLSPSVIDDVEASMIWVVPFKSGQSIQQEIESGYSLVGKMNVDDLADKLDKENASYSNVYQMLVMNDFYFICEVDNTDIVRLIEIDGRKVMKSGDEYSSFEFFNDIYQSTSGDIDEACYQIEESYGSGDLPKDLMKLPIDKLLKKYKNFVASMN